MENIEIYFDFVSRPKEEIEEFAAGSKNLEDFNFYDQMVKVVGFELYKNLALKYPSIKISPINTAEINPHCCCPAYGTSTIVIKNPETAKFMIISFCDKAYYICKGGLPELHPLYEKYKYSWGWDMDNCVKVFQPVGVQKEDIHYSPAELTYKYSPCSHIVYHQNSYNTIEQKWKDKKSIPEKLFFRGQLNTYFRKYASEDPRFEMTEGRVSSKEFVEEMAKHSIVIDFNSVAEISCRTIEGMGLACAVIRPKLLIQYHNKLIPNFHYAAVDCDDLGDFKKLADAYIQKFEELKSNPDLVQFYSKNGREWYEQNCKLESYIKLFINELINLDELK